MPAGCAVRLCPLVVVSHPRGQTAERMRDSVQMNGLIAPLLAANFAVLLGGDGGPTGWGSPAALTEVALAHASAVRTFPWNGRTYALGISMGGLLALRSSLPGAPYAVSGVALIDAWVDLSAAWGSALSRRSEIEAAYGVLGAPGNEFDPLYLTLLGPRLPLFIASSPDDSTVSATRNSARLSPHADPALSEVIPLRGEHLGANRFTPGMAARLVAFLKRLEGPTAQR
ncbi:alpha/beta hydrolase [Deinococcus koreensis]|uniref:Alpha/beta hydrolase n=1 Tax=Deinococcus koreensis TaxID=2054903 RepID=A0A2K3V2Y1_9DEIO|nr:alpha/beta hydrolase [Deinococcus koreensis]